jgi:hypothetical protein
MQTKQLLLTARAAHFALSLGSAALIATLHAASARACPQGNSPQGASCANFNDCCSLNCGIPQAGMCGTVGAPNACPQPAGCCKGDEPSNPAPPPGQVDINWCAVGTECCTGNCQLQPGALQTTCCSAGPNPGGVAGNAQACVANADCCSTAHQDPRSALKCRHTGEGAEQRCSIPDNSATNCLVNLDCYSNNCHANDPRPGISTCRCIGQFANCGNFGECCLGLFCDATSACSCLTDNQDCSLDPCCASETCGTLNSSANKCCAAIGQACGNTEHCCDGENCVGTPAQFHSNTGSCCATVGNTGCTADSQCCSTGAGDGTCWIEQHTCVLRGSLPNGAGCRSNNQCASHDCDPSSGGTCVAQVGDSQPCADPGDCSVTNETCGLVGGASKCCTPLGSIAATGATCCDSTIVGAGRVCLLTSGTSCGGITEQAADAQCYSGDCRAGTCSSCGNKGASCLDSDDCCSSFLSPLVCDTALGCQSCIAMGHGTCSSDTNCCQTPTKSYCDTVIGKCSVCATNDECGNLTKLSCKLKSGSCCTVQGMQCASGADCCSGDCYYNSAGHDYLCGCTVPPNGGACQDDDWCCNGYKCIQTSPITQVCQPGCRGQGDPCTLATGCCTGHTCVAGTCT